MVRVAFYVKALALVAVCATAAQAQGETQQTCVEPSVVTALESQVAALEQAQIVQLEEATARWATEKTALEAQFTKEKDNHHATAALLRNAKVDSDKTVGVLEAKLEAAQAQVKALDGLLAAEKASSATRDSEIADAKTELAKLAKQVSSLEKEVQQSRKKNEALRHELENSNVEVSLSALLSSYYDEGVVLAGTTVELLREQADQSSGSINQVLKTLDSTTQTIKSTTEKLYAENLAATVDPILSNVREAADPHVQKILPIVQEEVAKAKAKAIDFSHEGLRRAKSAREEAIVLLQQNENVAPYSQKIIDAVLIAVAVPLLLVQIRLVLRIVFWVISTIFYVLTLGYCCGACAKKRSKLNRNISRSIATSSSKKPATPAAPAASTASKKNKKKN